MAPGSRSWGHYGRTVGWVWQRDESSPPPPTPRSCVLGLQLEAGSLEFALLESVSPLSFPTSPQNLAPPRLGQAQEGSSGETWPNPVSCRGGHPKHPKRIVGWVLRDRRVGGVYFLKSRSVLVDL